MANYIFFVTRCTICRKPAEVEEEENSCIVSFRMDKKNAYHTPLLHVETWHGHHKSVRKKAPNVLAFIAI